MSYAPLLTEQALNQRNHSSQNHSTLPASRRSSAAPSKRTGGARIPNGPANALPIIVHCHLCWDWVWQRPQQFISRLSRRHKILFVETLGPDPQLATPVARFRALEDFPNITVVRVQFPSWRWGDGKYVDAERRRIVKELLAGPLAGQFERPIQWFYDPMAVAAFAGEMDEALTVYDCMDELSKFKGAPPEIMRREAELLSRADVVFTGGYRLFEAKRRQNENCHFYGCGVDGEHFGKARDPKLPAHERLRAIKKPVLGYFGVIDERIDYELLSMLADAHPDWSVAMVGPALKVDEASLPKKPNLYWLGQQAYADLPAFCKGFDVCLMPFAMNEATEFINPTKALEYMATGRTIVSTPVPDVVRNFGGVVKIGAGRDEFIEHCKREVAAPDASAVERGLEMARENSWERIVGCLENHLAEALARKSSVEGAAA